MIDILSLVGAIAYVILLWGVPFAQCYPQNPTPVLWLKNVAKMHLGFAIVISVLMFVWFLGRSAYETLHSLLTWLVM